MRHKVWINKYGIKIKIKEMSDEYIKNCVIMIINSANPSIGDNSVIFNNNWVSKNGKKYLNIFYKELRLRNNTYLRLTKTRLH